MLRYLTSAHAIALLALFISLGGVGYTATGGNFILGNTNVASTPTVLQGPIATRTLQINNGNTTAGATALVLSVAAGHPPMKVNSTTKVANLNVDRLDGLDSLNFARSKTIPFDVALGGGTSAPIVLPVNRSVFVMVSTDYRNGAGGGSAFATVMPLSNNELSWVGLHACCLAHTSAARGSSSVVGTNMLALDSADGLFLEVAGPNSIRIFNDYVDFNRTGTVTLIW